MTPVLICLLPSIFVYLFLWHSHQTSPRDARERNLEQLSGRRPKITLDFLCATLISSQGPKDLCAVNPGLSIAGASMVLRSFTEVLLLAVRAALSKPVLGKVRLLLQNCRSFWEQRDVLFQPLLIGQPRTSLCVKPQIPRCDVCDQWAVRCGCKERYLAVQTRSTGNRKWRKQVSRINKQRAHAKQTAPLRLLYASLSAMSHSEAAIGLHLGQTRHGLIATPVDTDQPEPDHREWLLDPRMLLFEFLQGILLRKRQTELLSTFLKQRDTEASCVHQMLMGAGKTSVVGPLLALLLADGRSLVTQVMPTSLFAMARHIAWSSSGRVWGRRVLTLHFSRYEVSPDKLQVGLDFLHDMSTNLRRAKRTRALVLSTPTSLKSLLLKYLF